MVGHEEAKDILKDDFIKPLKLPQLYQGEFYDSRSLWVSKGILSVIY